MNKILHCSIHSVHLVTICPNIMCCHGHLLAKLAQGEKNLTKIFDETSLFIGATPVIFFKGEKCPISNCYLNTVYPVVNETGQEHHWVEHCFEKLWYQELVGQTIQTMENFENIRSHVQSGERQAQNRSNIQVILWEIGTQGTLRGHRQQVLGLRGWHRSSVLSGSETAQGNCDGTQHIGIAHQNCSYWMHNFWRLWMGMAGP